MSLESMRRKQEDERRKRAHAELTAIEATTIHWRALVKKFTHDDIAAGTRCTIKLVNWTEGPAVVVNVHRNKHGVVWKLDVRPEFDNWGQRHERPWHFTLSNVPAHRFLPDGRGLAATYSFKAFRYGNPKTNDLTWQHRRLLVGHGDVRNPNLTSAIAATRGHPGVMYAGEGALAARMNDDAFYASTEYGIGRFLKYKNIGAGTRDTQEKLVARVDDVLIDAGTHAPAERHPPE